MVKFNFYTYGFVVVVAWSGQCDLIGDVVMWAGVVVLFAIPAMTVQYPTLAGCFLGMPMGPHSGLSLLGSIDCLPQLEHGTWNGNVNCSDLIMTTAKTEVTLIYLMCTVSF